ncbi:hypothetical protein DL768_009849 [Monosporascus sp. mg162]|nr:hypothetical protein DL768_009849 [Monosporascus sp. mg162]
MSELQVPPIPPKARQDIRKLQTEYDRGNKKPLEDLIRAWKGIQELPPDHRYSFFRIAGYHGEPFRGAGWGNPAWWGGYCNHGNVLFPVWHRAYLLELEKALQSIKGCGDVTLPYWNETDSETENTGLPKVFLQKTFKLDGEEIRNPLYSYKFQAGVYDNLSPNPDHDYTKPPGYETVRYPFSGLVGPKDADATKVHNQQYQDLPEDIVNGYLNDNVKAWLGFSVQTSDGHTIYTGNRVKYRKCLDAPNYTVFSNTTSAMQWNEDNFGVKGFKEEGAPDAAPEAVVSLESPHNALHLAIGGFEMPGLTFNSIANANGDMGENDTAAFDPLFYFHHCFIDKVFWDWQLKWNQVEQLEVIDRYPGTNSVDNQGPTPGVAANTWLDMDSPLEPFEVRIDDKKPPIGGSGSTLPPPPWPPRPPRPPLPPTTREKKYLTGRDVANILKLGYSYEGNEPLPLGIPFHPGPVQEARAAQPQHPSTAADSATPVLRVPAISRGGINGSFIISTWAGDKLVDVEPVLSRWHVQGCSNCQNHLNVKTFVPLYGWTKNAARNADFQVKVHTRSDRAGKVKFDREHGRLRLGHMVGTKQRLSAISRYFAEIGAAYILPDVTFHSHEQELGRLRAISAHPVFSKNVRSLMYFSDTAKVSKAVIP